MHYLHALAIFDLPIKRSAMANEASGLPSRNATNIFNNYSIKKKLYSLDQFAEAVVFDAAAQTGTVG